MKVFARGNLSLEEKAALVSDVEQQILDLQRAGELNAVYILSGKQQRRDNTPSDVIGTINLEFAAWDKRRSADLILGDIIERTRSLAGVYVETSKKKLPPVGNRYIFL